jgi:WD40 repeat protein
VTFTPDGQDIVSSSWEGSVRVWDAATGQQRRRLLSAGDEHFVPGTLASIASTVSPDGKTLAAATWESPTRWTGRANDMNKSGARVRLWDRESGRELSSWFREIGHRPFSWGFSPDGKTIACMTNPEEIPFFEAATGKGRLLGKGRLFGNTGGYLAFSPDGKLLATAPDDGGKGGGPGSFTLREAATYKELCSVPLPLPEGRVYRLLFSPDGRMLATASTTSTNGGVALQGGAIHLWPLVRDESHKSAVRVGPPRLSDKRRSPAVRGIWECDFPHRVGDWAFSPDGRMLAIAAEGGTIRLVETASGKERARLTGHSGEVTALSFAPDGRRLASGSYDTTILVWDVTGRLLGGRLRPLAESLRDAELEKLWADLASDNAGRAGRAIWTLAAAPDQAVPCLGERLRPLAVEANKALAKIAARIAPLLRDLDDDAFAVRDKARRELKKLGAAAEPVLRQALAKKGLSLETRRRLEQLLKAVESSSRQPPTGEALRNVRALEVLEQIGTREARAALKALTTDGEAESSLTHEARLALERLERTERR